MTQSIKHNFEGLSMTSRTRILVLMAIVAGVTALAPEPASAQAPVLIRARSGAVLSDRMRVDSSGAFVAYGFMRDVGNTTGCAAQHPTGGGAGTRRRR